MDDASLAALRLSIEVGLENARRELTERQDDLAEAHLALAEATRSRDGLQAERARWKEHLHTLPGHILSGQQLGVLRRRGEAIEAREGAVARRHEAARAAVADAAARREAAQRAVAEQLARQRWIDVEARRGRETRERHAARREDEE